MLITPNIDIKLLNREYFLSLIKNGHEENIHLDYKEQISSGKEVAKDLSSFANSDGGNIIYGIKEDGHKPVEIIPIEPIGIKEKLDQIAKDGIDPSLNIKIWPIDIDSRGQIFVVYIPKKYPILHYAKQAKRFYKRTNFTSSPMERYEIDQAYKLRQETSDRLNNILIDVEDRFENETEKYLLKIRFIVYPINYGNELFKISTEMNSFFKNDIPKTPKYKSLLFWDPSQFLEVPFRQNDYFFKSIKEQNLADCLVRMDGIIIYKINFNLYQDYEKKELLSIYRIFEDPIESVRRGVIFDEKVFQVEIIIDYFLGFLDFLNRFYTKLNYFGDFNITLKINKLASWKDSIKGNLFRSSILNPISKDYNVELIPRNKLMIVKEMFNPIFNGFGLLEEQLINFFAQFETIL